MTYFEDFAKTCSKIEKISSSLEITSEVSEFLVKVDEDELEIVTRFFMGRIFPEWSDYELGIGTSLLYSAISKASKLSIQEIEKLVIETGDVGYAAQKALSSKKTYFNLFQKQQLSIKDVYLRFKKIANTKGKNSQDIKIKNLQFLFSISKPIESLYIARLSVKEMRIGVGEGIIKNAISLAFDVSQESVEKGYMVTNDYGHVVCVAKKQGENGLKKLKIVLNRPIKVMLAQISPDIKEVIDEFGNLAVEWKYDGVRLQIHKDGNKINIFSRNLENITNSLPDIVNIVKSKVKAENVILDSEVIALGKDNRPIAFQQILKRLRRKHDIKSVTKKIPLSLKIFDILYLNNESLIDEILYNRRRKLVKICPKEIIASQEITDDIEIIKRIYKQALESGHEGVILKNPNSVYLPGKRGKNWLKLKPIMETLDLVVIGGEWGEGRRTHFIGSYLLACRDNNTDKLLSIGRMATGITDKQLNEFTELFREYIISEDGIHIRFKPEIVFEVAFEEIQKSSNYSSGYALRFPRFIKIRKDKGINDIDSIDKVKRLYETQRGRTISLS